MAYLLDQLIEDFRSDVADRGNIDGDGNRIDTLWSDAEIIRYANMAVEKLATDTLAIRKNLTVDLVAGKALYRLPYRLLDIVRVRMTYGAADLRGRYLSVFDIDDGYLDDDYGLQYFTTLELETKEGPPRGVTRDYDPDMLRVFPIPTDTGQLQINADVVPQELFAGMPVPFTSFEDRHLLQLWMKNLAYRKQDADVLDLSRADAYRAEYISTVRVRAATIDRDRRDCGIAVSNW